MGAKIFDSAKLRPGKCAITGNTTGPFIDTGKDIPQYGRVYLSITGLRDALQSAGFILPEEKERLLDKIHGLENELDELVDVKAHLDLVVEAITPHIDVEPEIRVETKTVLRKPTDEEIEEWVAKKGGNHPAVRKAQVAEKGSYEEWRELYGDTPPGHPDFRKTLPASEAQAKNERDANRKKANAAQDDLVADKNVITIHDQDVDLNEVLRQNVDDVLAWAEGHEEEVHLALVNAEIALAEAADKKPRKGVLEGLGYSYDFDENEDGDTEDFDGEDE